jgi:hypothetical protein
MTRKLEEFFDLPPMPDQVNFDTLPVSEAGLPMEEPAPVTESQALVTEQKQVLDLADKINAALPQVKDADSTDADFDEYAKKAMDTYDRLVDLGMNVDDRNAGLIFDVASKMMGNAISAKNSKLDAKLRRIELQLKAAKLQLDNDKFQSGKPQEGNGQILDGEGYLVTDRNALLESLAKKINDAGKSDK